MGRQNTPETFWATVGPEPMSGCWLWAGTRSDGYGLSAYRGQSVWAHRLAYRLSKGPIPPGYYIAQRCHVRSCVNPDHLDAVTPREHHRRRPVPPHNRRKPSCPRGHPYTGDNLYRWRTYRYCRQCKREAMRRSRLAVKRVPEALA